VRWPICPCLQIPVIGHVGRPSTLVSFSGYSLESVDCWCGGTLLESRWLYGQDVYGTPMDFWLCERCGTTRASPYFTLESVIRFYRCDYRRIYASEGPDETLQAERRRAREQWAFITRYSKPNSVLDIGCGYGGFLAEAPCQGQGVEVGSGVSFDEYSLSGKYDLLTFSHSLEHSLDPLDWLRRAVRLLNEEGRLFIEVPKVDQRRWTWVYQLEMPHKWYFDLSSLEGLLDAAGFRVVAHESPFHLRALCERAV